MVRSILFMLFVLGSACVFGTSKIIECDSIGKMYELADDATLCIIDIDNTLYRPKQMLGSDEWVTYSVKGTNSLNELEDVFELWRAIQIVTKIIPMEKTTSEIVNKLQGKCLVMSLTSRPSDVEVTTRHQLQKLGIFFQTSSPIKGSFNLKNMPLVLFSDGILYTKGQPKGKALQEFFQLANLTPKKIICIDDHRGPLEEIAFSLPEDVDYTGLRLRIADKYVASFDPRIAECELTRWRSIISDDAAEKRLHKNKKAA